MRVFEAFSAVSRHGNFVFSFGGEGGEAEVLSLGARHTVRLYGRATAYSL